MSAKLHDLHGDQFTLAQISRITGIKVSTLKMRARRGAPLDKPVGGERAKGLTGDRDRDLKAIITACHRDVIRKHQKAVKAGRCEQCRSLAQAQTR